MGVSLVTVQDEGLFCPLGDFFIDPIQPVERAILTHAHADHARPGSQWYLAATPSLPVLKVRLGEGAPIETLDYGVRRKFGEVWVSLHSAGHVLGSAQVRIEHGSDVLVVSGDYKRAPDPSCEAFEVVACNTFITEATFGLPIYRWPDTRETAREILAWWQSEREQPSMLFCYAFGKAQRVLGELAKLTDRPVFLHGAMGRLTEIYRAAGVKMLPTTLVGESPKGSDFKGALIIAPPSAHRSAWMKRFKAPQTAFASGWMAVRGNRRRRGYERGFVLSDHADWYELLQTVRDSKASKILLTHGQTDGLTRYLREEMKLDAEPLGQLFEGEADV